MNLINKTAIVTGAGQGIGAAIVKKLSENGARVAAMDLNIENVKSVIQSLKGKHLALQCNVGKSKDVINAVRKAREVFRKARLCSELRWNRAGKRRWFRKVL